MWRFGNFANTARFIQPACRQKRIGTRMTRIEQMNTDTIFFQTLS